MISCYLLLRIKGRERMNRQNCSCCGICTKCTIKLIMDLIKRK